MPARSRYEPGTFCWADLSTNDGAAAQAFYGPLLGWEFAGPIAQRGGAAAAAIYEQQMHAPHWNVYVAVQSADESAARAVDLGAAAIEAPFDVAPAGRLALLQDPTGAVFAVWQADQHIGAGVVNEPGALTWTHLVTSDVARATGFYADLFGWEWEDGVARRSDGRMACSASEGEPAGWSAYFAVADLAAAEEQVGALGGRVLAPRRPAGPGEFIAVADPAGAAFCLYAGEMDD